MIKAEVEPLHLLPVRNLAESSPKQIVYMHESGPLPLNNLTTTVCSKPKRKLKPAAVDTCMLFRGVKLIA